MLEKESLRAAVPCRKAINFDLDTNALKKIFQSNKPSDYLMGYRLIGKFLRDNGFTHRQWSGYVSKNAMSRSEMIAITENLNNSLPWLKMCVKKFDVTNIGEQFDLTFIFKRSIDITLKAKTADKSLNHAEVKKNKGLISRNDIKNAAKKLADKEKSAPKVERKNKIERGV